MTQSGDQGDPRDRIIAAAVADPAVRQALKTDPRGTIRRIVGTEVPAGVEVEVLEERADKIYLVLPAESGGELSDDDLDAVAGGAGMWSLALSSTRISRGLTSTPYMTDVITGPTSHGKLNPYG
ncbi:MAG: NHLP leader peptide family natural product precursor [Ectothiorhodospiraceae bacterium]|nr:NHLP leader peptide family natural product precursor [Chromatiales bacterium]MCP5154613.1 NHLP leader peptide family natural product precursor [Ectothiorhodospiraceae bacterium]